MRGTLSHCRPCTTNTGIIPRMRGTPTDAGLDLRTPWDHPAYAGNTWNAPTCWANKRDHPRVCGEHFLVPSIGLTGEGSSPRMRGTLYRNQSAKRLPGIIPWRMRGTPIATATAVTSPGIIPRMRGTPQGRQFGHVKNGDHPPRMRGTHDTLSLTTERRGIIPCVCGGTL